MAHFAEVKNGKVLNVIVAEQDFIEEYGQRTGTNWVQTSYNTTGGVHYNRETKQPSEDQSKALRKNFAAIGDVYDRVRDAFYAPQPYPSWTLNEDTCMWTPPVDIPEDTDAFNRYTWNEETQSWDAVTE